MKPSEDKDFYKSKPITDMIEKAVPKDEDEPISYDEWDDNHED